MSRGNKNKRSWWSSSSSSASSYSSSADCSASSEEGEEGGGTKSEKVYYGLTSATVRVASDVVAAAASTVPPVATPPPKTIEGNYSLKDFVRDDDALALGTNEVILAHNVSTDSRSRNAREAFVYDTWKTSCTGYHEGGWGIYSSNDDDSTGEATILGRRVVLQKRPTTFGFFSDDGTLKVQGTSANPEIPLEIVVFQDSDGNRFVKKEWHVRDANYEAIHDDALATLSEYGLRYPEGRLFVAGDNLSYPLSRLSVSLDYEGEEERAILRQGDHLFMGAVYAGRCPTKEFAYVYLVFEEFLPNADDEEVRTLDYAQGHSRRIPFQPHATLKSFAIIRDAKNHPAFREVESVELIPPPLVFADVSCHLNPKADVASGQNEKHRLHDRMRDLWTDHVYWTRLYIVEKVGGLSTADATAASLMKNQEEIGALFGKYFGAKAGSEVTTLLKEHISQAAELVDAAMNGEEGKVESVRRAWEINAESIALYLHELNPDAWSYQVLADAMAQHLKDTLDEATHRIKGETREDVRSFKKALAHIQHMSELFVSGMEGLPLLL